MAEANQQAQEDDGHPIFVLGAQKKSVFNPNVIWQHNIIFIPRKNWACLFGCYVALQQLTPPAGRPTRLVGRFAQDPGFAITHVTQGLSGARAAPRHAREHRNSQRDRRCRGQRPCGFTCEIGPLGRHFESPGPLSEEVLTIFSNHPIE